MDKEIGLRIIAEGLGVQTVTLYLLSSLGIIPRADYAIFADPGAEKDETYRYLEYLDKWRQDNNGIPLIHSIMRSTIKKDLLSGTNSTGQRFASIPAFTSNPDGTKGMLRRQCTFEYKISVVDKEIRKLYGLKKYERLKKTEIWMGITLDEIERAKSGINPKEKWKLKIYPFLNIGGEFFDKAWTRSDCRQWLIENNFPIPPKSACVFCPFQGDNQWVELKTSSPTDFDEAVYIDKAIRDSSKKGAANPIYLHGSCKPLDQVDFNEGQGNLFINGCEEGYCGL